MATIKEFVRKESEEKKEEKLISDEALKFINKGGGSTQSGIKKASHKLHRLTLRIPNRIIIKLQNRLAESEYPISMNQWIINLIIKFIDD